MDVVCEPWSLRLSQSLLPYFHIELGGFSTTSHSARHLDNLRTITQFTIQIRLRAFVQHTGIPTVAGMYKNCTKEESPEIGI